MIQDFRWSDFKRVVDIGGANGTALAALLQAESKLDGILFEQPQVLTPFLIQKLCFFGQGCTCTLLIRLFLTVCNELELYNVDCLKCLNLVLK